MKKRIISTLLALTLVLGLFPVTALPVSAAGTLHVGNLAVTGDNSDVLWDGKVSYDSSTNTLTLNNAVIKSTVTGEAAIRYNGSGEILTLQLVGTNVVDGTTGGMANAAGIAVDGANLLITGSGSLEAFANSTDNHNNCYGINVSNGSLKIKDTTVTARAAQATTGVYVIGIHVTGYISIENSTVHAYAQHDGVAAVGDSVDVVSGIFAASNGCTVSITANSRVTAMAWAEAEGLLAGMEGITTPDAPALRVQIAHMLLKVLER